MSVCRCGISEGWLNSSYSTGVIHDYSFAVEDILARSDWMWSHRWEQLHDDERARLAASLVSRLPEGFEFRTIEHFSCGTIKRAVARFSLGGRSFSLLPGARDLRLGYDELELTLNAADVDSLIGEFDDREAALAEFARVRDGLHGESTAMRVVDVQPLLVEERARNICDVLLPPEHAAYGELARGRSPAPDCFFGTLAGIPCQVEHDENGSPRIYHSRTLTTEEAESELSSTPFRFLSEDEWEYACGAGSRSYFRWGSEVPVGFMPPGQDDADRSDHFGPAEVPNAFGLSIANDPYYYEFCRTPGVLRGGDGGESWCGGEGTFRIWRTLGTSFRWVLKPPPMDFLNPFTRRRSEAPAWRPAARARARRAVDVPLAG